MEYNVFVQKKKKRKSWRIETGKKKKKELQKRQPCSLSIFIALKTRLWP